MNTSIRLLKTNDRWRLWQVGQHQESQSEKNPLRKIRSPILVMPLGRTHQEGLFSRSWSFKQNPIKFRKPSMKLLVKLFKSLWVAISQRVKHSWKIRAICSKLRVRARLNSSCNRFSVKRKDSEA